MKQYELYKLSLVDVNLNKTDDILEVKLGGEIDMSNTSEIRSLLEEHLTSDVHELRMNLSDISFIDSSGITLLLSLNSETKKAQQKLRLIVPQMHRLRHTLRMMGVDSLLHMEVPGW